MIMNKQTFVSKQIAERDLKRALFEPSKSSTALLTFLTQPSQSIFTLRFTVLEYWHHEQKQTILIS